MRFFGVLLLCGALGACYNPSYGDCQVSCASGACPSGLECVSGVCRAAGMTGPCTTIDGGSDGGAGISVDELTQANLDALCKSAVRCGQFEDLPTCERFYGNIIIAQVDAIAAAKAGTTIFHGDKAKQCLEARDALGCERWKASSARAIDPVCFEVFEGTRHDGETCAINEQCISQTCKIPNCSDACCSGTCAGDRPPGPRNLGETCSSLDRCQNSYCEVTTGVCTAYKTGTEVCTYSDQCADGEACVGNPQNPTTQMCRALIATNGACSQTTECLMLGDVCKSGKCTAGGLLGSTCAAQGECQMFHSCSNSQCTTPPELNQSCLDTGVCMEGYCAGTANRICTPKVADGAMCNPNMRGFECASGYCDQVSGLCKQKPVCN